MNQELIRTDKNGTKYWQCTDKCCKCGGTGIIQMYIPINGGVCFDCDGSGVVTWTQKEYTPEYQAKLDEQRAKREAKRLEKAKAEAAQHNAEFFEKNGFTPEGKTYFVLGNTYDIKEELKAQGARWDNISTHWHMAVKPDGLEVLEVSVEEMYDADFAGRYFWNSNKRIDWSNAQEIEQSYIHRLEVAESNKRITESPSEYYGTIGDKVELKLKYTHTASWENAFGGWLNHESITYLHTFKDEAGNIFIWKTSLVIDADYGTVLTVKGTIKDHSEYKGIKQTVLTRCKITE